MAEKEKNPKSSNGMEDNVPMDLNTDENLSGTTHLNDPVEEESEVEKLRAELDEARDKYLRKVAEFDNSRRRHSKELREIMQTAGKDVIRELLDVLDDCDRAQKQIESSPFGEQQEGVLLVFSKLRNVLQSRGLRPMNALGQDFNPDLHEAVTEIEAPTEKQRGKVIDEIVKGYYLNDHIIRHAKVVVGK
jgi:molecular chaperone GrpE